MGAFASSKDNVTRVVFELIYFSLWGSAFVISGAMGEHLRTVVNIK